MSLILPTHSRGPTLDLELSESEPAINVVVSNKTTGKSLTIGLPAEYEGGELHLDWHRRTVRDQNGVDRLAWLDPDDLELWTEAVPMAAGANDVRIEARYYAPFSGATRSPGAVTSVNPGFGSTAWSTPTNAKTSDNNRATVALSTKPGEHTISQYLWATTFSHAVPAGGTPTEVVVGVESSMVGATLVEIWAHLIVSGVAGEVGTFQKLGELTTEDAYLARTFPVSGLTPSVANAADFGVAVFAQALGEATARVDHIRTAINGYTLPAVAYQAKGVLRWEKGYF